MPELSAVRELNVLLRAQPAPVWLPPAEARLAGVAVQLLPVAAC